MAHNLKRQSTDSYSSFISPKKRKIDADEVEQNGENLSDSFTDSDGFSPPHFGASFVPGQTEDSPSPVRSLAPGSSSLASQFRIEEGQDQAPQYNAVAEKLMAKMGYKKGKGLGKNEQGRANIVEASKHKGRRGLGMTVSGFEPSNVQWATEKETVSAVETVDWIPKCQDPVPPLNEMMGWMKLGQKKRTINDETHFCSGQVLTDVLSSKNVFDNLEGEEMRRARTRSNPYETIRGAFFLNRAAMKMANMDAVLDNMFTSPKDSNGKSLVQHGELLYFADICAGPGGFSEYILWRKKWDAKGFGFTLRGPCDFKLEDFFAAPSELFEPHYGVGGLEGDGDIYRADNLREFRRFVWDSTDGKGLHFVMADGGFSVDGQENLQEILSKRLYLCQCLCALSVLREGGSFVCKLFDLFTPFSVGLVYLMYKAFDRVAIFKPVTSRPANSERYIICQGRRADALAVHDYMFEVNHKLAETFSNTLSDADVTEVVPLDVIQDDTPFFDYIVSSNETVGLQQAIALSKIQAFAQNTTLHEMRQSEMREECLKRWNIPDQTRTAPDRSEPAFKRFARVVKEGDDPDYHCVPVELSSSSLDKIHSVFDYHCVVVGSEARWFLYSIGRSAIFKWDGRPRSKWQKLDDVKIELPRNTVLEVEFVMELRGEGKGQKRVKAVHVIDGMFLYQDDIRSFHYRERIQKLQKFIRALTRPTRSDLAPIRVKDVYKLDEIKSIFDRLEMKVSKTSRGMRVVCYRCQGNECPQGQPPYITPVGVLLIKAENAPWMVGWSKSSKRFYYYNTSNQEAIFHRPPESVGPYKFCLKNRLLWTWSEGVKVHDDQQKEDSSKISKAQILEFIHSKLPSK